MSTTEPLTWTSPSVLANEAFEKGRQNGYEWTSVEQFVESTDPRSVVAFQRSGDVYGAARIDERHAFERGFLVGCDDWDTEQSSDALPIRFGVDFTSLDGLILRMHAVASNLVTDVTCDWNGSPVLVRLNEPIEDARARYHRVRVALQRRSADQAEALLDESEV